jgi:hypothetical protein
MGNVKVKTKKGKTTCSSKKSFGKGQMISEEDIRNRAFEIFRENSNDYNSELEDWFRAERELSEIDQ